MRLKQIAEHTVPVGKTEKVTLPVVVAVHVKVPIFNGSSHWMSELKLMQFEAAASINNWMKKDKAVSLIALKGSAAELLQNVPPYNQNTYDELIKALEL